MEIVAHLRNNARKKITDISKQTNIPVTTIYDRVLAHNRRFVKKHVTLLDFAKLGFLAKAHIAIKVHRDRREALQKFLLDMPNVNSLYKVNFGYDFVAETVFKDAAEMQNFTEQIQKEFRTNDIKVFNVVEELKKEDFLTKPEHFE